MKYSNIFIAATLMAALVSFPSYAAKKGNKECPVGLVNGMTLNDEFGPGTPEGESTQELTRCNKVRTQVKMVVQLNQYELSGKAYGLGNITNIIDDYEITHGMTRGKDYEIVVVIHSGGGRLALKNSGINGAGAQVGGRNAYQGEVETLMGKGVKFYFCQNTMRTWMGLDPAASANNALVSLPKFTEDGAWAADQVIEGMLYTTAGLTAIADFEALGYQYIQP